MNPMKEAVLMLSSPEHVPFNAPPSADRLPLLPPEIMAQILRHVGVEDIGNARQVCISWYDIIEEFAPELWEARCNALGLLPNCEDSALGRCVSWLRSRLQRVHHLVLEQGRTTDTSEYLASIYRAHYFTWTRSTR